MTIPVRLGDTIPGYVAATKLPITINLLKQVNCATNTKESTRKDVLCFNRKLTSNFPRDLFLPSKVTTYRAGCMITSLLLPVGYRL